MSYQDGKQLGDVRVSGVFVALEGRTVPKKFPQIFPKSGSILIQFDPGLKKCFRRESTISARFGRRVRMALYR
jgi:hypothetical protein